MYPVYPTGNLALGVFMVVIVDKVETHSGMFEVSTNYDEEKGMWTTVVTTPWGEMPKITAFMNSRRDTAIAGHQLTIERIKGSIL